MFFPMIECDYTLSFTVCPILSDSAVNMEHLAAVLSFIFITASESALLRLCQSSGRVLPDKNQTFNLHLRVSSRGFADSR